MFTHRVFIQTLPHFPTGYAMNLSRLSQWTPNSRLILIVPNTLCIRTCRGILPHERRILRLPEFKDQSTILEQAHLEDMRTSTIPLSKDSIALSFLSSFVWTSPPLHITGHMFRSRPSNSDSFGLNIFSLQFFFLEFFKKFFFKEIFLKKFFKEIFFPRNLGSLRTS